MDKGKNILIFAGVLLLYLFMQTLAPAITEIFNIKNKLIINILLITFDFLTLGILIFIYRKDFKKSVDELSKDFKNKLSFSLKLWLFGLLFMMVSNSLIDVIVSGIAENEAINRVIIDKYTLYAIPSVIIIAPICEEIIFRLSLKKIFKNDMLFAFISGLLFGLAHVIGSTGLELLYILPYGALGFVFAYIFAKTKNILCPILMHMLHNFICIVIILFM